MRQIVIDTETTGLRPEAGHRVIEIGCVELINRRLTGEKFQRYINPAREVGAEAIAVHGITNEFLEDKPLFKDVVEEFVEYIKGAELIAHNAPFDVGFLDHEFKLTKLGLGKLTKYCKVFDTLKLARRLHPGQRNSLDALSKRYQVEHFNRDLHGALLDAEILSHVYLAMTGGQATLFAEQSAETNYIAKQVEKPSETSREALPIIEASADEIAAHKEFLEMLKKESDEERDW